jgi:hypothetical protein
VEIVALIRPVCFYVAKEMSNRFSDQRINVKFCVKLSSDMKHGAFNMIPKAKDKVGHGNSRYPHEPIKLAR